MKRLVLFAGLFVFALPMFSFALPVIAVLDFEPKKVDADIADIISEKISIEMVKSGQYQVVERSKIKSIIEEQKLQLAGLTGGDFAEKLGKILAADKLMIGSVSKMGNTYSISAKIVDAQTGLIEKADSIEVQSEDGLADGVKRLVKSLTAGKSAPAAFEENPLQFLQNALDQAIGKDFLKAGDDPAKGFQGAKNTNASAQPPQAVNTDKPACFSFDGGIFARYSFDSINLAPYGITGNLVDLGFRLEYNPSPFFGFGIGGGAWLPMNNTSKQYAFYAWNGGVTATFNLGLFKFVRFQASALIGIGGFSIDDITIKNTNYNETVNRTASTGIFVIIEPTVTVTFNVAPFFDFGAICSYSWTSKSGNENFEFPHGSIGLVFIFGPDFL
jgi:TolB-like protein